MCLPLVTCATVRRAGSLSPSMSLHSPGRERGSLTYAERNAILLQLGFPSYRAYLKSHLWADIRQRVLASGQLCGCENKARQVHHRLYTVENLSGLSLYGLVPVCRYCHRRAEIAASGKCSLREANARLDKIWRRNRARNGTLTKRGRVRIWCPCCDRNRALKGGPCPPCADRQRRLGEEQKRAAARSGLRLSERPVTADQGQDTKTSPAGASPGSLRLSRQQGETVRAPLHLSESGESQSTAPVVDNGRDAAVAPAGDGSVRPPSPTPLRQGSTSAVKMGAVGSPHQRLTRKSWSARRKARKVHKAEAKVAVRLETDCRDAASAAQRAKVAAWQRELLNLYREAQR
jgi:hypothetical protein